MAIRQIFSIVWHRSGKVRWSHEKTQHAERVISGFKVLMMRLLSNVSGSPYDTLIEFLNISKSKE